MRSDGFTDPPRTAETTEAEVGQQGRRDRLSGNHEQYDPWMSSSPEKISLEQCDPRGKERAWEGVT